MQLRGLRPDRGPSMLRPVMARGATNEASSSPAMPNSSALRTARRDTFHLDRLAARRSGRQGFEEHWISVGRLRLMWTQCSYRGGNEHGSTSLPLLRNSVLAPAADR